jgi:DNA-binding GntR family transcriptional regulator
MGDEVKANSEPEKVIEAKALTSEDVQAAINVALEAERRKYQSKLDQVIAEKKAVESAKLTDSERLAALEAQLAQERASAKRKEAKALAGFDDDFEQALLEYSDADKAKDAAVKIKSRIEADRKALMDKIEDYEKRLQYGTKAPSKGSSTGADLSKMSLDEAMEYAKEHPEAIDALIALKKKR